jgi:hypothetical protein
MARISVSCALAAMTFIGILCWLATPVVIAQSLKTVGQLTVFDADGKTVGKVLDAGDGPSQGTAVSAKVAFRVHGGVPAPLGTSGTTLFVLNVFSDGFATDTLVTPPVAWQSNDCSGTPFLGKFVFVNGIASSGGSMPLVAVGIPGNTVYVENGAPQTVTIGSYSTHTVAALAGGEEPVSACVNTGPFVGGPVQLFPARAVINLNDHFRAPFVVRERESEE